MPATVVVGAQWGDEGKGKLIDILASRSDVVIRSQGGNNAGHTVVDEKGEVYKLKLIPSGILYKHTLNLIGCGTVVDPGDILGEIDGLAERGVSCDSLRIDARAHVIMPWHPLFDKITEEALGEYNIGTTRRGIGPCYMDKAERSGLRMHELVNPEVFRRKAMEIGKRKNEILKRLYSSPEMDLGGIIECYTAYGKRLAPYVADVSVLASESVKAGKNILFEGAQGAMLDINMGTYPFVTSSNPISAGVCTGTGVGPKSIDEIIGVGKAYTSRVGSGPFPTEMLDALGDKLRDKGNEYGTVTGRPRRVGWFDSVVFRYSARINGLTGIAINKLDTLSGMGPLKVCTAYQKNDGTIIRDFPPGIEDLEYCIPVYEELPGFDDDISGCRSFAELPHVCQSYISRLEELCGCPIKMVGVGPSREQLIHIK